MLQSSLYIAEDQLKLDLINDNQDQLFLLVHKDSETYSETIDVEFYYRESHIIFETKEFKRFVNSVATIPFPERLAMYSNDEPEVLVLIGRNILVKVELLDNIAYFTDLHRRRSFFHIREIINEQDKLHSIDSCYIEQDERLLLACMTDSNYEDNDEEVNYYDYDEDEYYWYTPEGQDEIFAWEHECAYASSDSFYLSRDGSELPHGYSIDIKSKEYVCPYCDSEDYIELLVGVNYCNNCNQEWYYKPLHFTEYNNFPDCPKPRKKLYPEIKDLLNSSKEHSSDEDKANTSKEKVVTKKTEKEKRVHPKTKKGKSDIEEKILNYLQKHRGAKAKDIATKLNLEKSVINSTLYGLKDKEVTKDKNTRWYIKNKE